MLKGYGCKMFDNNNNVITDPIYSPLAIHSLPLLIFIFTLSGSTGPEILCQRRNTVGGGTHPWCFETQRM